MKICWDNLEKLRYSKRTGKWYIGKTTYHYIKSCEVCNNPFLSQNKKGKYCSSKCYANSEKNKKITSELGKSWNGINKSEEQRKRISETKIKLKQNEGINNPNYGNKWTEE